MKIGRPGLGFVAVIAAGLAEMAFPRPVKAIGWFIATMILSITVFCVITMFTLFGSTPVESMLTLEWIKGTGVASLGISGLFSAFFIYGGAK